MTEMTEIFKTVLILSLIGFGVTALLLIIKPFALKRLSAKGQYIAWILAMVVMLVPFYKVIPEKEVQRLSRVVPNVTVIPEIYQEQGEIQAEQTQTKAEKSVDLTCLAALIWLFGTSLYIVFIMGSYVLYLIKKRRASVELMGNPVFENVKRELKIRRKIRLKRARDIKSPVLVGIFFPVIYIPLGEIDDNALKMMLLHEMTHYKRRDLVLKWLAVFTNAIHWFNPMAYFMVKNIGEVCEMACDRAVTEKMTDEEQKAYMKTIIDLA